LLALVPALLTGCDIVDGPSSERALRIVSNFNDWVQARLFNPDRLAETYPESAIKTPFPFNAYYSAHEAPDVDEDTYKLVLDGLIDSKQPWTLDQLYALPQQTQITRHDCVEGWSAIGKWHGVQLSRILDHAGLSTRAKYIVFHCADRFGDKPFYESIDLVDAFHPQTIIAWGMNGHLLPVPNGAPLRLRVERQLGYKHAKYVQRIEAVDSLEGVHGGKGGYWEDNVDYEWYAGI
jgi:DMSO/TMAO reductase YedYZ molybdopterin-dependent catalytic subunit